MDTSGFSQVGRHGTLSLIKRNATPPESDVITSFGIDDEELTFGSVTTCGVRLYYPEVDALHCKLVFEERKAFLAVIGAQGALVDGCKVYPHTSGGNSQTIIPLTNNSEFEIHNKRFRFTYPPKEIRKALYATPARPPKRALRLSMIHSAQVFSPRPSKDPRENLKILQSPIKNTLGIGKSPVKSHNPSPLKQAAAATLEDSDEEEEEQDIVLVHTNHPRVVEEERDLVILEDVPVSLLHMQTSPAKLHQPVPQWPQPQPQPPKTPPRRRSLGGNALHRAVLIRSAQRAVLKAEKEREEEEEELEVLDSVVANADDDDEVVLDDEEEDGDVEMGDGSEEEEEGDIDDEEEEKRRDAQKPLWRKSLERIIPWPFNSGQPDEEEQMEDGEWDASPENGEYEDEEGGKWNASGENDEDEDEDEEVSPLPAPSETPVQRPLGSFMTPGPRRDIFAHPTEPSAALGRYSLGGGEAQRVLVQQPWRVRDLVVPPSTESAAPAPTLRPMDPPPSTPVRAASSLSTTPSRPRATPAVSEEERKAIQERRRSALKEVDSFWADGAPGMSPAKNSSSTSFSSSSSAAASSGRNSTSPVKPSATPARPAIFGSPTKGRPLERAILEEEDGDLSASGTSPFKSPAPGPGFTAPTTATDKDSDEEMDTRGLLERMKETVEGMKRRRSTVLGGSGSVLATPQPVVPAPGTAGSRMSLGPNFSTSLGEGLRGIEKLDFTRITPAKPPSKSSAPLPPATPVASAPATPKVVPATPTPLAVPAPAEQQTTATEPTDSSTADEEPFSLLRPGAHGERRQSIFGAVNPIGPIVEEKTVPVVLPTVVDGTVDDAIQEDEPEEEERPVEKKARGRSRLLRAPKATAGSMGVSDEDVERKPKSATKVSARRQRSRTPQPRPSTEEENSESAKRKSTTRRTRKATAEPEEPTPATTAAKRGKKAAVAEPVPDQEDRPQEEVKAKRGRKARAPPTIEGEPEHGEVEPTPAPAKRGRPRKVTVSTPEESSTQEETAATTKKTKATTSKTTTPGTKRAAPSKPRTKSKVAVAEEDDDEDPLDSYHVNVVKNTPKAAEEEGDEFADLPASPPRRIAATAAKDSSRSKTKTATRKKTAVIKHEEDDDNSAMEEPAAPLAATRGGRGKTRGRPKTPATAPAAVGIASGTDEKENTPGTGSAGSEKESGKASPDSTEDAPVKVRVSRTRTAVATRKTAASKVKVEPDGDEGRTVAGGRANATRVMRTRTKTG
ncbi:hypothetical protein NLJ89_g1440 [Agrocybe chaxingu]|uniref:FHA domain-containing protein n=1 Tax=Agrocybe chaxingu TaxID=84603 RepID=A0A9W8TEE0_9AGAR|nr:hypothetical protein NLJ89_g1440 [Agrocybe chaxingu]